MTTTTYPAPDGGPDVHLIPRDTHRAPDHTSSTLPDAPTAKWEALGKAVLAFHFRVALTAGCRCGRTVVECDVLAQARALGLLPPLPQPASAASKAAPPRGPGPAGPAAP